MTDALDRRALLALAGMANLTLPLAGQAQVAPAMRHDMPEPANAPRITMLVYPRMVVLDLAGPMSVFKLLRCRVDLVGKDRTPVETDLGFPIAPTRTFADADRAPDVLFVPGGLMGTVPIMNDPAVMGFLADRGARAKWVTSVCTGGLALGAAGLLDGYDATAHWQFAHLLPLMGARHVDRRVVIDRNRMTGGGVTAGIDFGLTLAAKLRGEEEAKKAQLILEYAPEPPFHSGTPHEAAPELVASIRRMSVMEKPARIAAEAAAKRLGLTARS